MAYRVINEQEAFIATFIFSLCFTSLFCQTHKILDRGLECPSPARWRGAGMSVEHPELRTAPESQNSNLGWVGLGWRDLKSHPVPPPSMSRDKSHYPRLFPAPSRLSLCPDPALSPVSAGLSPPCASVSPSGHRTFLGLIPVPGCEFRRGFWVTGVVG